MSATDVSICSNALLMLGAQPINDLSEANDRARLASNLYESLRDSVLRSHPWNCAIKRVALAPDATAPAFDWTYQFTLPGDCLRVLSVGFDGLADAHLVEDRKLLCNANPAYLRYVYRNTNPTTWDAQLVHAMELAMAAGMAYGITQSASLRDSLLGELAQHMRKARSTDGQEDPPQSFQPSVLIGSRYSGRGF
jgi:hypothetical protein